jgi:hypothetical protein
LAVRNNCSSFELKGGELLERGSLFFISVYAELKRGGP